MFPDVKTHSDGQQSPVREFGNACQMSWSFDRYILFALGPVAIILVFRRPYQYR